MTETDTELDMPKLIKLPKCYDQTVVYDNIEDYLDDTESEQRIMDTDCYDCEFTEIFDKDYEKADPHDEFINSVSDTIVRLLRKRQESFNSEEFLDEIQEENIKHVEFIESFTGTKEVYYDTDDKLCISDGEFIVSYDDMEAYIDDKESFEEIKANDSSDSSDSSDSDDSDDFDKESDSEPEKIKSAKRPLNILIETNSKRLKVFVSPKVYKSPTKVYQFFRK